MDLYSHIQVPKRVINMHEKHHAWLKSFGADSGGVFDCLCFWVMGGSARYLGESARYLGESARYLSESARYLGESARYLSYKGLREDRLALTLPSCVTSPAPL